MIYSIPLAAALALAIACDLVGLSMAVATKWVKVEYRDGSGARRRAYFAEGSKSGWGGVSGGTMALYQAITHVCRVGELPAGHGGPND